MVETRRTSVLDRLLNSDSSAGFSTYHQQNEMIQNVRRDLQDLLNTRRAPTVEYVDEYAVLNSSVLNYGIEDFSSFNPESESDRNKLKLSLENLISTYEPRLKEVQIKLLKNTDDLDFRIRFHIDAILNVENVVMPVQFDSIMESSPPRINIKGARYE